MKIIGSHYSGDCSWISRYTEDYFVFDRTECGLDPSKVRKVANIGSDLYDKFTYIIENYNDLPEVALYTKTNLSKFISPNEFELVRNNKTFTPILTMTHKTYMPTCFYQDGLYWEINSLWYLNSHPPKSQQALNELLDMLNMRQRVYNAFAPGSSYILTRKDIKRHPKKFYEKLRSFLDWSIYPGEAHVIERSLYYIWGTDYVKSN